MYKDKQKYIYNPTTTFHFNILTIIMEWKIYIVMHIEYTDPTKNVSLLPLETKKVNNHTLNIISSPCFTAFLLVLMEA